MRRLALVLGLLPAAGWTQDPAESASPLELSIEAPGSPVALAGNIQLDVTLKNTGAEPRTVAPLLFDERSISFDVEWDSGGGRIHRFRYAILNGTPEIKDRLPLERVVLKPGSAFSTAVILPAVLVGTVRVTAVYAGSEEEIRSRPVEVKVEPAGRGKQTRLAARMTLRFHNETRSLKIRLAPDAAPNSVCQFVSLAKRGFYNGLKIFSIVRNSWMQTGCPYNEGHGTAGFTHRSEAEGQPKMSPPLVHGEGTVSFSQAKKLGWQGSQFFICLRRLPYLDGKFTIIGQIDLEGGKPAGSDVLYEVSRYAGPEDDSDRPRNEVVVESIDIIAE